MGLRFSSFWNYIGAVRCQRTLVRWVSTIPSKVPGVKLCAPYPLGTVRADQTDAWRAAFSTDTTIAVLQNKLKPIWHGSWKHAAALDGAWRQIRNDDNAKVHSVLAFFGANANSVNDVVCATYFMERFGELNITYEDDCGTISWDLLRANCYTKNARNKPPLARARARARAQEQAQEQAQASPNHLGTVRPHGFVQVIPPVVVNSQLVDNSQQVDNSRSVDNRQSADFMDDFAYAAAHADNDILLMTGGAAKRRRATKRGSRPRPRRIPHYSRRSRS